jgi:hypothetical protein
MAQALDGLDRAQDVTSSADIPRSQQTKCFAYSGSAECQITQLLLIARSCTNRFGEDRRIGGDADDLASIHHAGQAAGQNAWAA